MSDKTINQFLKEMAQAGFTFDYRATNGEMTFVGKCVRSGADYTITHRKVENSKESMRKIRDILNDKS
jgi:hypothetical protein